MFWFHEFYFLSVAYSITGVIHIFSESWNWNSFALPASEYT